MKLFKRIRVSLVHGIKLVIRNVLILVNAGLICLPIKKHYYLFESFNGKDISDNPAAIYRQLVKDDPSARKRAFFGVKPRMYHQLHARYPQIRLLRRFLPRWIYYTARAQFWVFNSRMPTWWLKNQGTVYVQTWHGTPLKKLGLDIKRVAMPGISTQRYKKRFVRETRRWNYLIAPNRYSENIFQRAFRFHHQFLEIGYPRNDVLYRDDNPKKIREIKRRLLGRSDVRVITYAPTWRDDDYLRRGAYRFEWKFSLRNFFRHVGPKTFLIIRPHYLVKSWIRVDPHYQNRVKVMRNEDISQIYLITDLLITDYSSVMFDFANLNRPMLFFSYDLNYYKNKLRGFYFDYRRDIPGPLATNERELDRDLDLARQNHGYPQYQKRMKRFRDKYCTWGSAHSSAAVIRLFRSYN